MGPTALLIVLFFSTCTAVALDITVKNLCPSPIEWFMGDLSQGTLATGASVLKQNQSTKPPTIYTTANAKYSSTSWAGIYFEPGWWYYYTSRDRSSDLFNVGISITPNQPPNGPFCDTAVCKDGNCTSAFIYQPIILRFPDLNIPSSDWIPSAPHHQCKVPGASFEIIFCPDGNWPQIRGASLMPGGDRTKCLDVQGGALVNGTPVQIYDCNDTNAQRWILSYEKTQVRLAGTNFCLDAGSGPCDGAQMKIWQCYDNLPAQQWTYNGYGHLILADTGLCLDLPGGKKENGNLIQTWTCGENNQNQVWILPDMFTN